MSIVPISNDRGTVSNLFSSFDIFDPEALFNFDLFDPFPSLLSTRFPSLGGGFFPSLEAHVDWKQNARAHMVRAVFPGFNAEDVLVHIDDDNVLQISTESGQFMSKFKLPDDAKREGIKASMLNGVLSIVIPKEGGGNRNVRAIEISGSG